jgi:hypothetical protein
MTETDVAVAYAVGDRVTVRRNSTGEPIPATVVQVAYPSTPQRPRVRFDESHAHLGWRGAERNDGTGTVTNGLWNVTPTDSIARISGEDVAASLREAVERAEAALREARAQHARDVAAIGYALAETAERHEWCGEYDEAVESLVPQLSETARATFRDAATVDRNRPFTLDVTVTASVSVTVEARSEDDAQELFGDDPHSFLPYAGGYDIEDVEVRECYPE